MDPALAALDLVKAGAIVADMVVSYLAAGAPPFEPEQPNGDNVQDCRPTPVEAGVHTGVDDPTSQPEERAPPSSYRLPISESDYSLRSGGAPRLCRIRSGSVPFLS